MSPMIEDRPLETEQEGFFLLQNGHRDMVEATAFSSYGDRLATSSVDGRMKVYNRHKDNTWNLCDTWTAHTGEILEVCNSKRPLSVKLLKHTRDPMAPIKYPPTPYRIHRHRRTLQALGRRSNHRPRKRTTLQFPQQQAGLGPTVSLPSTLPLLCHNSQP